VNVANPPFAVEARGLVVDRGRRRVLDGANIEVVAGERVAVIGPSGCGKTTLLGVLAGLERPAAGAVRIGGEDVTAADPLSLRHRIGLVFQGQALVSLLTAAENVELVLQQAGLPVATVRSRAASALDAVGLAARSDGLVDELSGGEQQRVAIARALVANPRVLLADEPTAELDAETRDQVLHHLLAAADRGAAIVLVTHDPAVAGRCDRTLRLTDGRLLPEVDPVQPGRSG
jgi:ABC-type lipoprotein export system ATPase subunit